MDIEAVPVVDNVAEEQFEIRYDGAIAYLAYERGEGEIDLIHTEVPRELEGHGLAARLASHALDQARERGETAILTCSYVRAYAQRHPEYESGVRLP